MNDIQSPITASKLWDFCLDLYSHKRIRELSLWFQDNAAINVNFVLFLAYLNKNHLPINDVQISDHIEQISALDAKVDEFRQYRRSLKGKDESSYQAALSQELEMEKEIQQMLVNHYNQIFETYRLSKTEITIESFEVNLLRALDLNKGRQLATSNSINAMVSEMAALMEQN